MRKSRKYCFSLPVSVLLLPVFAAILITMGGCSQEPVAESKYFIDPETHQQITEKVDYTETDAPPRRQVRFNNPMSFRQLPGFIQTLSYILLILAFLAFIYYLVVERQMLKTARRKEPEAAFPLSVENLDEQIEHADLNALLQQALSHHQYNIAVRLHFVMLLKLMSGAGLLKFSIEKTNRSYMAEVSDSDYYRSFRNIVSVYERIWFGNIPLRQQDYQLVNAMFDGFSSQISTHEE